MACQWYAADAHALADGELQPCRFSKTGNVLSLPAQTVNHGRDVRIDNAGNASFSCTVTDASLKGEQEYKLQVAVTSASVSGVPPAVSRSIRLAYVLQPAASRSLWMHADLPACFPAFLLSRARWDNPTVVAEQSALPLHPAHVNCVAVD
jgi:hypothetical protein